MNYALRLALWSSLTSEETGTGDQEGVLGPPVWSRGDFFQTMGFTPASLIHVVIWIWEKTFFISTVMLNFQEEFLKHGYKNVMQVKGIILLTAENT